MGRPVRILRSGDLYLVSQGDHGRLVPGDGRPAYPAAPLGSILAHCHASEPWEPASASSPDLPAAVRAVARAGITPPTPSRTRPR